MKLKRSASDSGLTVRFRLTQQIPRPRRGFLIERPKGLPGAPPTRGRGAIRRFSAEPQRFACELSGDGAPDSDRLP